MSSAAEPPDGDPDRCRSCQFRLRLRAGLTRAPVHAECPRCRSLVLFAEGLPGGRPSPFAIRMADLSAEERLQFYENLVAHLARAVVAVSDREIGPAGKVEQMRPLTQIVELAAFRARDVHGQTHHGTDRQFGVVVGGCCSLLDRRSRKAVAVAAATSYRWATGREIS